MSLGISRLRVRVGGRSVIRCGVILLCWGVALMVLIAAIMTRWPAWWLNERLGWIGSIGSNFMSAMFLGGLAVCVVLSGLRRWVALGLAAVGVIVSGWAVLSSLPRAGWSDSPMSEGVEADEWGRVRVLVFNVRGHSIDEDALVEIVRSSEADVVVLLEPYAPSVRALRDDVVVSSRFPHSLVPRNVGKGTYLALSRWPLVSGESWELPVEAKGVIAAIVDRPGGAFGLGMLHPSSPRTPRSARLGQEAVRGALSGYEHRFGGSMPVIIGADLNGTASSVRGLLMRRSGYRASKPLFRWEGTWPADRHAAARVAIDDVWVRGAVRAVSWETLKPAGSDHVPVLVDLEVAHGGEDG